ncbi:MAG: coenzyme F430 synthase, partial [Methanospirillum sp.]|nr:coenzyme F430 synthase [Methanospirillum sp.]
MRILILDTIHGGRVLAEYLSRSGHDVDCIDIYRHSDGISESEAHLRRYDLVGCPVHVDPDLPLLSEISAPVVSHHQIVRWLLKDGLAGRQVIEITGALGKSTTAAALAYLLPGPGLLHTSAGLVRYPDREKIARYSITPASLLCASEMIPEGGWFIGEISVGFCGTGKLGILTSGKDYPVASGKKSAFGIKRESSHLLPVLVPPDVELLHARCTRVTDLVSVDGDACSYRYQGIDGSFSNPLFRLAGYKTPLMLACAAALLLGFSPERLSGFRALPGRMEM